MSESALIAIAPLFSKLNVADVGAQVSYDMLSDALHWPDEIPDGPPRTWWAIRPILHHRACLAVGMASDYHDEWNAAQRRFPLWVGFSKERLIWSRELIEQFERSRRRSIRSGQ